MTPATAARLLALNREFYAALAEPFAASRAAPWPGFARLAERLAQPVAVLDVGCGEGRFGRFLAQRGLLRAYTGLDGSPALLARAAATLPGDYHLRDLADPAALRDLGRFDVVACIAVLQHLPGRALRLQLLRALAACLATGGYLLLVNWQPTRDPRQLRKLRPWETIGLRAADVEPGDYLLAWERGGSGLRYVAEIAVQQTAELAAAAGLTVREQFYSDGRLGDLNLYSVLMRREDAPTDAESRPSTGSGSALPAG